MSLNALLSIYEAPRVGPRVFMRQQPTIDRICRDAQATREFVNATMTTGTACLDVWARHLNGSRVFAPIMPVTLPREMIRAFPLALRPSGQILHDDHVTCLFVLDRPVIYTTQESVDTFEALRRRLWGLSPRRLRLDDGYPVPGGVLGVDIQKFGAIIERRARLDFYDNTHTVSIERLEALLPESIAR